MRPALLSILACPGCGGDLSLADARSSGERVASGRLGCAGCGASFPVRGGIPRFGALPEHRETQGAFEAQWRLRFGGAFAEGGTLYGQDHEALTAWLVEHCLGGIQAGGWLLDAGCGTGEKAILAARQNPHAHVVGMDLSETVERSLDLARGVPNVDFVQGDVMHPPFRRGSIARLISWGVLHHTSCTARAFAALVEKVAPDGAAVVQVYPHEDENPAMAFYYRVRDVHFLGLGHRLPPRVRLRAVQLYCAAMAPLLLHHYVTVVRPIVRRSPWMRLVRFPPWRSFESAVFLLYDALTPPLQYRHRRAEVEGWFQAAGFGPMHADVHGHYWASRPRTGG